MWDRLVRTSARWTPVAGGALFLVLWLDYRDFWLDDAFITFRYARNLAEGLGPVFNPGERVEGYTTFAWMLLVSVPFALGLGANSLAAIKLTGLGLGLLILWRAYTFPAADGGDRRRPVLVLLAANPIFVANCGDGMETPLFAALLLECARACTAPPSTRSALLAGVLTAACGWTRPEALPLLLLLPAAVLLLRGGRAPLAWAGLFGLGALPPILAHQAWRLAYYGAPLPNTFYAKATGDPLARLSDGLTDVLRFLVAEQGVPALGLWIALGLAAAGLRRRRGAGAWLGVLWGLVGFRVAFDLWSGGEAMGHSRFLAPALPPLFVLADEGARGLAGVRSRQLLAAAVTIGVGVSVWGHTALREARDRYAAGLARGHAALGDWLAETRPEGTWLALGDVGIVPFRSRLPTIDLWGLTDATIARLPGEYGDRPGVASYVLERRPGIVVIWNVVSIHEDERQPPIGAMPFDREIVADPVFRREYRFVREFTFAQGPPGRRGYYLDVFVHRPGEGAR